MLSIKDVSFSFGNKSVLNHVSMYFSVGSVTGILGRNGTGKTTLFRVLTNIYKRQSGVFNLNGNSLKSEDIAFMPTDPFFYPYMKGREYLEIVANNEDELRNAKKVAHLLELPLDLLVDNYSTGMRKKLAFAAIFSLYKPIVILDEPYNGVDLESNEIIQSIIKRNHQNKIVIVSSHILSTITSTCDQVYLMSPGKPIQKFESYQFNELDALMKMSIEKKMDDFFGEG
jgi:ABC-2 type transport system ATP-binding protein